MIEKLLQYASSEIKTAIKDASQKTGIGFDYLLSKAFKESSFREEVTATTSSASGLFQFVNSTWMNMVKTYGDECGLGKFQTALKNGKCDAKMKSEVLALRSDPGLSSFMAAKLTQENQNILQHSIGRKPNEKELYLAHFMGPSSAGKFINQMAENPNAVPCDRFKSCAQSNPAIFNEPNGSKKSYQAVFNQLTQTFSAQEPIQQKTQTEYREPVQQMDQRFNPGGLVPNSLSQQHLSSWMLLDLIQLQETLFDW